MQAHPGSEQKSRINGRIRLGIIGFTHLCGRTHPCWGLSIEWLRESQKTRNMDKHHIFVFHHKINIMLVQKSSWVTSDPAELLTPHWWVWLGFEHLGVCVVCVGAGRGAVGTCPKINVYPTSPTLKCALFSILTALLNVWLNRTCVDQCPLKSSCPRTLLKDLLHIVHKFKRLRERI